MEPFGMPWSVANYYVFSIIIVPIFAELVLHSKWWKEKSEYYFSFNDKKNPKAGK